MPFDDSGMPPLKLSIFKVYGIPKPPSKLQTLPPPYPSCLRTTQAALAARRLAIHPARDPTEEPPEPAAHAAGIRHERDTPTAWGSHASSLTPVPSHEHTPAPSHPVLNKPALCHTQSLSLILGDRAGPSNRKRDVRSPSPTLGIEIAAQSECLRQLRAQLDNETAELEQLTSTIDADPRIQTPGIPRTSLALDINPLGDPILPSRAYLIPSYTHNTIHKRLMAISSSHHITGPHPALSADPDDDIIPGFQASGVTLVIPDSIIQNMRKGWKTLFSIAMLRDDYCIAAVSQAHKGKTIAFGDEGDHVTFAASAESYDSSLPEDHLTYEQWVQVWCRLIALIRQFLSEALYVRWLKHYQYVDMHPDRSKHWTLWLRYDIAVRVTTRANKHIDPSVFQSQIFSDLITQYTLDSISAMAPASQGTSTTPRLATRGLTKPTSTPTTTRPQGSSPNRLCFRCGRDSHTALACSESKQASGRDIIVQHGKGKDWLLYGQPFCYKHNGAGGPCAASPCKNGPHICSLCGSDKHGAQSCH
ncbi:hypothetical protein RSAG8_10807, partial [Rhizoctonia solani AG-8 WAC10335]